MNQTDRLLLLAFGVAQAVLYSSLLPLWEGFDEPWHYGYVQYLATAHRLPVLGETHLSQELRDSMLASPVSHVTHRNWPELQTFDEYFHLSPEARAAERGKLESIPRDPVPQSANGNYEIQQAPLAYALLAPFGFVLQRLSMPVRILWLRIVNALLTVLGIFVTALLLFKALNLPAGYQAVGLFCIFACQMFWAATAHITNDGAALIISVWFFAAIAGNFGPIRLSLITALGLLTKAYFLPLAAFALCVIAWRNLRSLPASAAILLAIAGPWYARNLLLYHNLTGLQMSLAGIPAQGVFSALLHINWLHTIPYMLRATLWTGNSSFTDFSVLTLNCLLALFAIGFVLYAASGLIGGARTPACRADTRVDAPLHLPLLGALSVFTAAVIYVAGNDVLWLHGASVGPCPWYTFPLFIPLLGLSLLGLSRRPRLGRPVAIGFVLLSAWICIATYIAKLIPLYAGYPEGKSTLAGLWNWYSTQGPNLPLSLAPPVLIYLETALVAGLAVTLATRLSRSC